MNQQNNYKQQILIKTNQPIHPSETLTEHQFHHQIPIQRCKYSAPTQSGLQLINCQLKTSQKMNEFPPSRLSQQGLIHPNKQCDDQMNKKIKSVDNKYEQKQKTGIAIDMKNCQRKSVQTIKFDYDMIYQQIRLFPIQNQFLETQQTQKIQQSQKTQSIQQKQHNSIRYHYHSQSFEKNPFQKKINVTNIQSQNLLEEQQNIKHKTDKEMQTTLYDNSFLKQIKQMKQSIINDSQNKSNLEYESSKLRKLSNFSNKQIKIRSFTKDSKLTQSKDKSLVQSQNQLEKFNIQQKKSFIQKKNSKNKSFYLPKLSVQSEKLKPNTTVKTSHLPNQTYNSFNNVHIQNSNIDKHIQKIIISQQLPNQFDFGVYIEIYQSLQNIQSNLKNASVLKHLKKYLELISSGKVDKFEYIRAPLHKKKLIKNSLLYERVAIVIIAFSFVSDTINESFKHLSNLIKFVISNHLIILKILSIEYNKTIPEQLSNELKQLLIISNKQYQSKGYETIRDNNEILEQIIFRLSKYDHVFYQNLKIFMKNSVKFTLQQTFYFILEYFAFFLNVCDMGQKISFLAVAPNPYLPAIQNRKYTLVLDFIDIMCNPKKIDSYRPYSQYFLDQVSEYYQIVSFSIAFPNQINKSIDNLDRKKKISHRLFRHHAIKSNGIYIKDLKRLGRDMSRIIILDSQQQQYKLNKQNSITVNKWTGNSKDATLAQLCPLLAMIVMKNQDVRQSIEKYKEQMVKNVKSGIKYINYGMNLD